MCVKNRNTISQITTVFTLLYTLKLHRTSSPSHPSPLHIHSHTYAYLVFAATGTRPRSLLSPIRWWRRGRNALPLVPYSIDGRYHGHRPLGRDWTVWHTEEQIIFVYCVTTRLQMKSIINVFFKLLMQILIQTLHLYNITKKRYSLIEFIINYTQTVKS